MADAVTTRYSWTIPTIGTSAYAPKWNTNLQSIDTDLSAVSDAADAAQTDADAAQADATNALVGKLALTPSTATVTGSPTTFATSIDFATGGPVYFADFGSVNLGGSDSTFDVTFTNRPVGAGRMVWLHCKVTNTGAVARNITTRAASAVAGWVMPMNVAMVSSTATSAVVISCTAAGDNITQWVVPFYILGS